VLCCWMEGFCVRVSRELGLQRAELAVSKVLRIQGQEQKQVGPRLQAPAPSQQQLQQLQHYVPAASSQRRRDLPWWLLHEMLKRLSSAGSQNQSWAANTNGSGPDCMVERRP
jgi:hypothetical protein